MSKEQDDKNFSNLSESINNLKNDSSEEAQEVVKTINNVGKMMDAIMAGRQLDLAFYSLFANHSIKKLKRKKNKAEK